MTDLNLQDIHDTLISVAHEAGRMILSANPQDIDTGTKLNCMIYFHRYPSIIIHHSFG